MKDVNDGGPAFPIGSGDMRDPTGMSLRDYFAAMAMQGLVPNLDLSCAQVAEAAYRCADAMLKQRTTPTKGAE